MPTFIDEFKSVSETTRCGESSRMRKKYPGRYCIIVDKDPRTTAPPIDKHKYLVPGDLTVGQFIYVIRKRLKLPSDQAIFVYVDKKLPQTSMLLSEAYNQYHDRDGFMYMIYSAENTFG